MIAEIFDALSDAIADALEGSDIQVYPRAVTYPGGTCVDLLPGGVARSATEQAFGELSGGIIVNVRVRTSTADSDGSQNELLNLMDEEHEWSILAALEDGGDFGGLVDSLGFSDPTGFQGFPFGDGELIGFVQPILVLPARS